MPEYMGYPTPFATATEVTAGLATNKLITPRAFARSQHGVRIFHINVTDPAGAAIAVGDGQAYMRVPGTLTVPGMTIAGVSGHVTTAQASGSILTVQLANVTAGVDVLSTKLTIDNTEKDSSTAATPAVVNTSNSSISVGDELRVDVDQVGNGTAKGLIVVVVFQIPANSLGL